MRNAVYNLLLTMENDSEKPMKNDSEKPTILYKFQKYFFCFFLLFYTYIAKVMLCCDLRKECCYDTLHNS